MPSPPVSHSPHKTPSRLALAPMREGSALWPGRRRGTYPPTGYGVSLSLLAVGICPTSSGPLGPQKPSAMSVSGGGGDSFSACRVGRGRPSLDPSGPGQRENTSKNPLPLLHTARSDFHALVLARFALPLRRGRRVYGCYVMTGARRTWTGRQPAAVPHVAASRGRLIIRRFNVAPLNIVSGPKARQILNAV